MSEDDGIALLLRTIISNSPTGLGSIGEGVSMHCVIHQILVDHGTNMNKAIFESRITS
jgi:hypothetical protein